MPVHRDPVDLRELCRAVVREHASSREIALEEQLAVPVEIDAERVAQLADNLVTNTICYGTGKVTLRLLRDGDHAVIAVHNHGTPIAPDQLATLFAPYRRAASSHGGVALGLYSVEQIARAHGGTVQVTSTAEAGTTFEVRLPITTASDGS